jgi:16S rRNA (cytosine1402-N4)-methyltransferase
VTPFLHQTVLRDAVVALLAPAAGARLLDGTLGGGGHAAALLEAVGPSARLVGIDRDPHALEAAGARLRAAGGDVRLHLGPFAEMASLAAEDAPFDAIVLDLGVSSPQLDRGERGFSLQHDGPVDMRMGPDAPRTAAQLIDESDEDTLHTILRTWGEEPRARAIARALVAGRPWTSTLKLASAVAAAAGWRDSRVHPATRTFQALRIAVNDELGQLDRGLDAAWSLLKPGGRLAVISFHSLEDRLVKQRFRVWSGGERPKDAYGHSMGEVGGRLLAPGGIAGDEADPQNPRARSARLRGFERTAPLGAPPPRPASAPAAALPPDRRTRSGTPARRSAR